MRSSGRWLFAALALATAAALAQGAPERSYIEHAGPPGSTVETAGFAMDDLVSGHYPARAFIGADKLVRGAHFEVLGP